MANILQLKRGTTARRLTYTPAAGELVLDTTTRELFVGNGTTAGGLPLIPEWSDWYVNVTQETSSISIGTPFLKADVYVDGLMQTPGYHYTISGTVINLGEPLEIGSHVYVKVYS